MTQVLYSIIYTLDIYGSLVLLQKGYRSYDTVIFDLKDQAMSNRKRLGELLRDC